MCLSLDLGISRQLSAIEGVSVVAFAISLHGRAAAHNSNNTDEVI
jgi:hypothetical protein